MAVTTLELFTQPRQCRGCGTWHQNPGRKCCATCLERQRHRDRNSRNTCECGAAKRSYATACNNCHSLEREALLDEIATATREGCSAESIASRVELSERQVVRYRARLRREGRL